MEQIIPIYSYLYVNILDSSADILRQLLFIIVLYCTVVGSRRLTPPDALQPKAYCTKPGLFSRSYLHRQVSPPETLVVKGETTWARNGPMNFA